MLSLACIYLNYVAKSVPNPKKLDINNLITSDSSGELGKNFPVQDFLTWFKENKRDLPWRHNPSFYEVLVSEFMLQQTVVVAVIPYYKNWMIKFPSLIHLAQASSEEVLKAWEGLGYYSRARRLHEIAKIIVCTSKNIPDTYEGLIALKGIGDYTAKAILAFAFKQPVIAVDGNVLRVGARFLGIQERIDSLGAKKQIQAFFDGCFKADGTMAEALIELGALICKKKADCLSCPLKGGCKAYKENLQEQIPKVAERKKTQKIESDIALCIYNNEVLITKHEKKLMKDLCEFPHLKLIEPLGYKKEDGELLGKVKASYTIFQETLFPVIFELKQKIEIPGYFWVSFDDLEKLSFSSGHKKIKNMIKIEKTSLIARS